LTSILSLLRSVSEDLPELTESGDVLKAHVLVEYFKDQTRKVFGLMCDSDPTDQLAKDVVRLVEAMGGHIEDEPTSILNVLRSEHKPERTVSRERRSYILLCLRTSKYKPSTITNDVLGGRISTGVAPRRQV